MCVFFSLDQVELSNGVSLMWDGRTRVYVTAPKTLYGQTKGMCGTFDENQNTDFITKEGDVEPNVNLFGNKWRTDPICAEMPEKIAADPCDLNAQRRAQALMECQRLRGDMFKGKVKGSVSMAKQCDQCELKFSLCRVRQLVSNMRMAVCCPLVWLLFLIQNAFLQ